MSHLIPLEWLGLYWVLSGLYWFAHLMTVDPADDDWELVLVVTLVLGGVYTPFLIYAKVAGWIKKIL